MSQINTRGQEKPNKKIKGKNKNKFETSENDSKAEFDLSDLMTKDDEELLQNIKDEDGECDIDIDDDDGGSNELDGSEISGFVKELGISKYRPFQIDKKSKENGSKNIENIATLSNNPKTQKLQPQNGEENEIKQEDNKKKEKKKKKSVVDDEEIKEEPEKSDQSTKHNKKNKKGQKEKTENEKSMTSNDIAEGTTFEKEEKPDLKALQAAMSYMKLNKSRSFLLLKPGELWREEKVHTISKIGPEDKLVKEAEILAERLLKDDIAHYTKQKENAKRSEARWLKTVLVSGTLSDKIAALTLLIQESPVHNLSSVDSLLSMAGKKGRREAMMAVDTLKDLFITGLLPDDRKLKFFHQFPLYSLWDMTSGNIDQRDKLLLCWYFEDVVKKKYSQFVKILSEMLFDTLQATKEKAVNTVFRLLTSKPEQEHVLLPMLVNKMGDQNLNNKASHLMGKLVEEHPNMKGIIVKEMCQLIYRPNVSQRAQYYAICFLTQLRLSKDESKLATELIKVYLSFFQTNLKKRDVDSKTMSALLTGVNRAYVFASEEKSKLLGQMNEVYKILPTINFQTGVQALMLLYHVTENDSNAATRFYSALYRKLNDPGLASTTKHAIFLNLLFKSLKRDTVDSRILAFIKRTLQVYSHHPSHIICGVLILLSQVLTSKPELLTSALKSQVSWDESGDTEKNEDEEENFVDLPIPEEFTKESPEIKKNGVDHVETLSATSTSVKSSWLHRSNKGEQKERTSYDPHHRNPLYSRAELECIWELEELTRHFHPTVSLYASMLLKSEPIEYKGDPLADYTLIRFLDRFVYKNPKKPTNQTNVGAPQQRAATGIRKIPINSKEYLRQKNVPEDEKFFFKYFTEKERQRKEREDDEDSVGDDEFDKYMDKYIDGRKEDFGDFNLDFAADTAKSKNKKGKKDESDSDDDDDDDDLEDMNLGDDELAAEFEKELQGLEENDEDEDESLRLGDDDEFNEEDVEFSPDEDDIGSMTMKPKGKKRNKESLFEPFEKSGKKKKMDPSSLFASAEEFSHLLEEGIDSGSVSLGGINQMRNQDKAAKKQIAWEEKRDKWIHDEGKSFKGKRKPKGKSFARGGVGRSKASGKMGHKFGKKGKK